MQYKNGYHYALIFQHSSFMHFLYFVPILSSFSPSYSYRPLLAIPWLDVKAGTELSSCGSAFKQLVFQVRSLTEQEASIPNTQACSLQVDVIVFRESKLDWKPNKSRHESERMCELCVQYSSCCITGFKCQE